MADSEGTDKDWGGEADGDGSNKDPPGGLRAEDETAIMSLVMELRHEDSGVTAILRSGG